MRSPSKSVALLILTLAVGACDSLDDLLGAQERAQKPLPGERIAVMDYQSGLRPDALIADTPVRMMQPQVNPDFAYETAPQQAGIENLRVQGQTQTASIRVGDGHDWDTQLVQQPVIGNGRLFAMDAEGIVTAHDAADITRVLWRVDTAFRDEDPDVAGGGLAYGDGVLYVTTGYGSVLALVAEDGSPLWRQETDVPIRAAPAIGDNKTFAVTIDNQLLAWHARTGRLLWTHRGIRESAVYLGSVTPVEQNGIVVVAYSSGELFAIRAADGSPLWSDTLITARRTSASAALTGIDATPLIRDGVVYAISNSGLMVANLLANGRGLWDMELSGYHTPWIAGEYVFVLSAEHQLIAIHRRDKRIKWVTNLRREDDDEDVTPAYTDPVMMNNRLVLLNEDGEMLFFNPDNGELAERVEIPESVRVTPVIAGGRMYLLDDEARLYQYQ